MRIIKIIQGIFLLGLFISYCSCNSAVNTKQNGKANDTVAYTLKNFKQRDADCGNNPDSQCTIVKVNYPAFDDLNKLNDSVTNKLVHLFSPKLKLDDHTLEQFSADFINSYHDFKKIQPKSTLYYLVDANAKVLRQDSALLTVKISGYMYHGGGHGVEYERYINWDTKKNESVTLKDVLANGYQDTLNKIAEHLFRKAEKLSDTSSISNGRTYFFPGNKFTLPDTYLISPDGICFLYNVYTIKAYAAGKTRLLVPYKAIKPLLLSNSIIAQYVR